jgi:hypothetical protein
VDNWRPHFFIQILPPTPINIFGPYGPRNGERKGGAQMPNFSLGLSLQQKFGLEAYHE